MTGNFQKELRDILRKRSKCLDRCNYTEAAKLSSSLGALCSANGEYTEACSYHKDEVKFCEIADDKIGEAIGHRKVGECFCELSNFEDALFHQRKHLQFARECKNLIEEQRALATMGRTLYLQSEDIESDDGKTLLASQQAYLESLALCDKLKTMVSDNELLEMRCRLYLNLGLVYEWQNELDEAMRFIKKALVISTEFKLRERETIFKCFFSLSCLLCKQGKQSEALQYARQAQKIAQDLGDRMLEADACSQLGQTLLSLGNFTGYRETLKKLYERSPFTLNVDTEPLLQSFKTALDGDELLAKLEDTNSLEEKYRIYEKLGDIYSDCKALGLAIGCYKKQLQLATDLDLKAKAISQIYVSLAVTYSESKKYEEAIQCYQKELELREGEAKENAATYCAIAKVQEDSGCTIDVMKETYLLAISHALKSKKSSVLRKVYGEYLDTLVANHFVDEAVDVNQKIESLTDDGISDEEDESQSQEEENNNPDLDFSEIIKFLQETGDESEEDEGLDEERVGSLAGKRKGTYSRNASRKKIKKVNEKGETPLHTACIAGNQKEVTSLLQNGADVNARDYCGWQPLHEAANHGHQDIAESLLRAGASVNDPGGQHCQGITPLHDAAQNGHLATVRTLVIFGANCNIRDTFGNRPIDLVISAIKAQEDEGVIDSEIVRDRKAVLDYLESVSQDPLPAVGKARRRDRLDSDEEDSPDFQPITDRRNISDVDIDSTVPPDVYTTDFVFGNNFSDVSSLGDIQGDRPLSDDESETRIEKAETRQKAVRSHVATPNIPDSKQNTRRTPKNGLREKTTSISSRTSDESTKSQNRKYRTSTSAFSSNGQQGTLNDFIVDDVQLKTRSDKKRYVTHTSSNRRRSVKQTKLSKYQTSHTLPRTFSPICSDSSEQFDSDYQFDSDDDLLITRECTSKTKSQASEIESNRSTATTKSAAVPGVTRVRVKVNGNLILIPCIGHSKIEWLSTEILKRCKSSFTGDTMSLNLYNEDGALLHPDDVIPYILLDNSEVVAVPSTHKEKDQTTVHKTDIIGIRNIRDGMNKLDIANEYLDSEDVKCMVSALVSAEDVTSINGKGCYFDFRSFSGGYNCLKGWVDSIVSRSNINDVDFSQSCITQMLHCLNISLQTRLQNGQYSFACLRTLNFDNVSFPTDSDQLLTNLFKSCLSLQNLSLSNCNLVLEKVFTNPEVVSSFSCLLSLQTLVISKNTLCKPGDSYKSNFIKALLPLHLQHLDIADTGSNADVECQLAEDIMSLMNKPESTLETLNLCHCFPNARNDLHFTEKFWRTLASNQTITTLNFSSNEFDLTIAKGLSLTLPLCTTLEDLVLSNIETFDNECLFTIIRSLGQCDCSLKRLDVSNTGIRSPIPFYLHSCIGNCKDLLFLDLTGCKLDQQDKNKLWTTWQQIHSHNDGINLEFIFVLSRRISV